MGWTSHDPINGCWRRTEGGKWVTCSITGVLIGKGLEFLSGGVSIRALPVFGPLAQLVEQLAFNQLVAGSNPARPTIIRETTRRVVFFLSGCRH